MSNITLKVNGSAHTVDIDPSTPLLYILRNDLGLQGPRFGCGLGQCGACTVIINGAAVRSCVTPCSAVKGEITTLEGLAKDGALHPLQQAWIDEQVPQCGFCQNGQIMTAKVLLDRNPNPTDAQIREGMAGTLCRCMTYYRIQAAIKRAATVMRGCRGGFGQGGGRMTTFTNIPKQVEELLEQWNGTTSRRNFLKSSGLLVVSFSAAAIAGQSARRSDAASAQAARSVSRPRLQTARFVDRHSRGQHRDVLCRQDGLRPGHRHRLPADDVRRTGHRVRQDQPASWAAPTSPSIRADRAVRMRFRPMAGRCGAWRPRRGAFCWRLASARFGVPVDQLAVSEGVDHRQSRSVQKGHLRRTDRRQDGSTSR